ncbi:uncharacterized protein LOC131257977 [Magnolia sinica]|uniref:uncharacterized protein LOC131257977 n=1 Tax=Magnolia sinica TaxID=86752 RepID=UPI0026590CA8|nr:uncharacterized protein LOC131257977 [Magnolia sinica]
MYVTWPLSLYLKFTEAALIPPPEGPNSGHLVVADEESEAEAMCCWGLCKDNKIQNLPFPQNKILRVRYTQQHGESLTVHSDKAYNRQHGESLTVHSDKAYTQQHGESPTVHSDKVYFIPVLNQPLSSNRYYVIRASGKYKGKACICSKDDIVTYCFCMCINDVKPKALDHRDMYHQVEIIRRHSGRFIAKSVASDGLPPLFLRRKGWEIYTKTPRDFQLGEARGVDLSLRARLPTFDFPISNKHSTSIVVGKWYIPFMFIKEVGTRSKYQMKKSMFYEMYLEQMWDEIHMCENHGTEQNAVVVNATVRRETATVTGQEAITRVVDGMMWLSGPPSVGLSIAVVNRMKWEACRGGWVDGKERDLKVERVEEFGGVNGWRKFGCYMLVERFVLRRMDGSLVLTYDFNHTHLIQSKWE